MFAVVTSSSWRVCVTTSLLHATPPTAGATRGPRAIAELPGDPLAPCPPDCCLPLSSHVPPGSLRRVAAGHSPPPGLPPRPRTDSDKRPERFMATLRTRGRKRPQAPPVATPSHSAPNRHTGHAQVRAQPPGCPHRGCPPLGEKAEGPGACLEGSFAARDTVLTHHPPCSSQRAHLCNAHVP